MKGWTLLYVLVSWANNLKLKPVKDPYQIAISISFAKYSPRVTVWAQLFYSIPSKIVTWGQKLPCFLPDCRRTMYQHASHEVLRTKKRRKSWSFDARSLR
jgi:hypothetical protein